MKTIYLILFCLIPLSGMGQIPIGLFPEFSCSMDNNENSGIGTGRQNAPSAISCPNVGSGRNIETKFLPLSNQSVVYVRINLIFVQRSDSSGNFQDNAEYNAFWDETIDVLNNTYAYLTDTNDPNCNNGNIPFISDAKVRFIANKIYIQDDYGWNNQHDQKSRLMCPDNSNWYLNYLDNLIISNPNIPRGINVYFTEDSINYRNLIDLQNTQIYAPLNDGVACSQFPSTNDYTRTSKLHHPDIYSKYWWMKHIVPTMPEYNQPWDPVVRSWMVNGMGRGLAHELGHSLWLYHESPHYPIANSCHYTIMHQGGNNPRDYLPPSEIGRVHTALSLTNVRTFVPNDTYLGVQEIDTVGTWHNMRLYRSQKINSNAEITLPCELTMPYQANIEVSGKLTVNNNIRAIENDWGGIIVKSGGVLELNTTDISDYNISVENGGTIIIRENLTISGNHTITINSGGYLCIEDGATIYLVDANSFIKILEGANIGVNPDINMQINCILPSNVLPSGDGQIIDYSLDVYLQNEIIDYNRYVGGRYIYAGREVTTAKPYGDVIVTNNANLILDGKEVYLHSGFECESGSNFEIK